MHIEVPKNNPQNTLMNSYKSQTNLNYAFTPAQEET